MWVRTCDLRKHSWVNLVPQKPHLNGRFSKVREHWHVWLWTCAICSYREMFFIVSVWQILRLVNRFHFTQTYFASLIGFQSAFYLAEKCHHQSLSHLDCSALSINYATLNNFHQKGNELVVRFLLQTDSNVRNDLLLDHSRTQIIRVCAFIRSASFPANFSVASSSTFTSPLSGCLRRRKQKWYAQFFAFLLCFASIGKCFWL